MKLPDKLKRYYSKRHDAKRYFIWMCRKTRPYALRIAGLLAIDILLSLTGVATMLINKRLIDGCGSADGSFDLKLFGTLIILTLASIVVTAVCNVLSAVINEKYTFSVRRDIYRNILSADWKQLSAYHSGDVVTRLTSDVGTIAGGIAGIIPSAVYLVFKLVLAFSLLYHYDPLLAIITLLISPLCALVSLPFAGKLSAFQKKLTENDSGFRSFLQETVSNITVIKSFSLEERSNERLAGYYEDRIAVIRDRNTMSMLLQIAMKLTFSLGYMVAFARGLYQLSRGAITYGTLSIFLSLVSQIQSPVSAFASIIPQCVTVLVSAGRVMELEELGHDEPAAACSLEGPVGVELKNVSYSYCADSAVLDGFNLKINPGETVGLIGPSGCGKTTAARIMLALIKPQDGECYFFDGSGRREAASAATRSLISYVPQGNTLLSGTIRDNLLCGDPNAGDEDMLFALELAAVKDYVLSLPAGLDAVIGENGTGLSEGQAQRIAIARALLKGAPFLILDEATSALDIWTEEKIIENLKIKLPGTACLVITHRPSLLKLCSRCVDINGNDISAAN